MIRHLVSERRQVPFLDLQNNKVMSGRGAKHFSETWFSSAKREAKLTRKKGFFFKLPVASRKS